MGPAPETLVEQFQEGRYLSQIGEYDAANAILVGCVITEPGDPDFVDGFLTNLALRQPAAPVVRELPEGVRRAREAEDWSRVLSDGPWSLARAPGNVAILETLADALRVAGEYQAELRYLRRILELTPGDVECHRRAGRAWTRLRNFDEALAEWKRVELMAPEDEEATRIVGLLVIAGSRRRGGIAFEPADLLGDEALRSPRPARAPKPASLLKLGEGRQPRELAGGGGEIERTPIQRLEAAIREYPGDPVLYLQLAPMYLEKGRDYDAEKLLAKGLKETENEPRLRLLWEDVTMQRLDRKIQQAQHRLEVEPSDEARSDYAELCAKRDRMAIDFFAERLKREPDNASLALEIGRRLRQAGRTREALGPLEVALAHEELRCFAAYELAEASLQLRDQSAAFRYFRQAIDGAQGLHEMETKKRALVRAAELAARIKLPALARSYLDPLLRLDPEHREGVALSRQLAS